MHKTSVEQRAVTALVAGATGVVFGTGLLVTADHNGNLDAFIFGTVLAAIGAMCLLAGIIGIVLAPGLDEPAESSEPGPGGDAQGAPRDRSVPGWEWGPR